MAGSKKSKEIKQTSKPTGGIRVGGDPDSIMGCHPSWGFITCDQDGAWAFSHDRLGEVFWTDIFPKLRELESMTWGQITINAKKQNHSMNIDSLNKVARDRLIQLHIEAESILSLRLGGTLRLYGFMVGSAYNILWYDDDHGDNDTCVCRSNLRYT